jgi:glycosyltransferase involved in cell wall biosynthesis
VTLSILLAGDYPSDPTLGSAKVFYKLQEEFAALGHRCDIVFGEEIGAPRFRQIGQLVAPWRAADAIVRRMDAAKYDVIDVASAEGFWLGVYKKFGGYKRTPLICRSNGLEQVNYRRMLDDAAAGLTRKGWTRRIWYPATRLSQVEAAARLSDRLLVLNEGDRRYALDHGWKTESEIDLVPHGVSSRFLADEDGASDLVRGEGLLFCGSWDRVKGINYIVSAFERLHERGRRLRLTVLGPGVSEAQVLEDFDPSVREFVRVVPRVAECEVIRMYRRHDLLLWTPTYEGFGLVLLEAMSQRLPAIATPVGCAPSIVRDGENGVMVPVRDPAATVSAVERLMDDASLRRRMGDAARAAVAGMTWRATALRTLEVYARAGVRDGGVDNGVRPHSQGKRSISPGDC